jgi:indoleamine 2,3-dioxygenase
MPSTIPHLQDYGVSETRGFLSDEHPLTTFTDSYFTPWDNLISHLSTSISAGSVRKQIHNLPLLDISKLSTEPEYRRAYVVLGFLTHAYVWSAGSDESPAGETIVPPQLAEPFLQACEVLGLRPVVSYAGLCLWNWKVNSSPSEEDNAISAFYNLDQLSSLASFTGSPGEDAFYHIPVLIEAEGGPLISLLLNAITASSRGDTTSVIATLQTSEATIARMMQHLPKMYARLDADEFYNQMRPFMAGGKGKLPRGGMVFLRSDRSEYVAECIGGSAAQSSLFQFLDLVLGTEHKVAAGSKETLFQVRSQIIVPYLSRHALTFYISRKCAHTCPENIETSSRK